MPFANVSSVRLHDQVLGNQGPWVALVSGARRGMAEGRGFVALSWIPAFSLAPRSPEYGSIEPFAGRGWIGLYDRRRDEVSLDKVERISI